jgi:hypothetical protein
MKNLTIALLILIITLGMFSCKKETISNRDKLILGKWDCVDYADSVTNELKGKPPVFISNLYEKGYVFEKDGLMWTRNKAGDNKMFTDKSVECEWILIDDNERLSLLFPLAVRIEIYDIIEMTRNKMILKGSEGFWAGNEKTYVFEKQ